MNKTTFILSVLVAATLLSPLAALAEDTSSLNPNTAGADIQTPPSGATTQSDTTLKKSCHDQFGANPYDIKFCKRKCAAGEKRFCACAKNPCEKYQKEFEAEKDAAPPASSSNGNNTPAVACHISVKNFYGVGQQTKYNHVTPEYWEWCAANPSGHGLLANSHGCLAWQRHTWGEIKQHCQSGDVKWGQRCSELRGFGCGNEYGTGNYPPVGTCRISDDQWTAIEDVSASYYLYRAMIGGTKSDITRKLEAACQRGVNDTPCRLLCKKGCSQYCDVCKISNYQMFRYCFIGNTPNEHKGYCASPMFANKDVRRDDLVDVNCNPATKKRGVGLKRIGMPDDYMSLSYGAGGKYEPGKCHERLYLNDDMLKRAFDAGELGSKEEYDGEPTVQERQWACRYLPECGPFSMKWSYGVAAGSSAENPIRQSDAYFQSLYPHLKDMLQPGIHSYRLPRYPDGSHPLICDRPIWVEYNGGN